MYTFDKMTSIMHQSPVKTISAMPASIAKFEKDLKIFRERTGEAFPVILKMPIVKIVTSLHKLHCHLKTTKPENWKLYLILVLESRRYPLIKKHSIDKHH